MDYGEKGTASVDRSFLGARDFLCRMITFCAGVTSCAKPFVRKLYYRTQRQHTDLRLRACPLWLSYSRWP
jgi:hypothetical protein